ncbi:MAG: hypothetical protein K9M99_01330 [Candidatus Cloacimonetes bacterium]|nr:hypothetical protein [Candidatus Cloacimonadota bacterium]
MKKELLYLLLVISLAFNLAFIGMFIWHRTHIPFPESRPDLPHIREKLQGHHEEMDGFRKGFMDERRVFMDFLKGDEFEEAKADSLLQSMLKKQFKMEQALGKKLIEMKKNGEFTDDRFPEPPHERRNKPQRRRK